MWFCLMGGILPFLITPLSKSTLAAWCKLVGQERHVSFSYGSSPSSSLVCFLHQIVKCNRVFSPWTCNLLAETIAVYLYHWNNPTSAVEWRSSEQVDCHSCLVFSCSCQQGMTCLSMSNSTMVAQFCVCHRTNLSLKWPLTLQARQEVVSCSFLTDDFLQLD